MYCLKQHGPAIVALAVLILFCEDARVALLAADPTEAGLRGERSKLDADLQPLLETGDSVLGEPRVLLEDPSDLGLLGRRELAKSNGADNAMAGFAPGVSL